MANLRPPKCSGVAVSFPAEHIMLVTLSRPKQMNSITHQMNWEIEGLFAWYDEQPSLRCAIVTGEGSKAFCAGSDLIEIETAQKAMLEGRDAKDAEPWLHSHPQG
jgi:enoyl-CoA hydratase/carnithine racemase